jgi:membrane protease YdiL (CAAX protease family)
MPPDRTLNIAVAWGLMLLVSDLPTAACKAFSGQIPDWLSWGKVGLLGAAVAACFIWKRISSLKPYALVLFVLFLALRLSELAAGTAWWQGCFGGENVSFTRGYMGLYLLDTAVALAVIAALLLMKRRRSECFLVKGDLSAPGAFGRAVTLVPAVLAFAAINAFNEEAYFRASFLSTLKDVIGNRQAVLISAVFFGMSHYLYGSPRGVAGFLMTAFLGWLLGKCMLETRGLFWPWFIHFTADVVVFLSYALTWVPT